MLVEQDLPLGGHSAPVIALKMGKFESKALDLSVSNWSSQVSGVLYDIICPKITMVMSGSSVLIDLKVILFLHKHSPSLLC